MPRSSLATVRSAPVEPTVAVEGPFLVRAEALPVVTDRTLQILDITDQVMARVASLGVAEGTMTISSLHTTCAVVINESQNALREDMEQFLQHVVDPATPWLHNDPSLSDCDRMNAGAHLRALTLSHGLTLQISGRELVLGKWQRVLVVELDGPRTRTLRLQVMGVA